MMEALLEGILSVLASGERDSGRKPKALYVGAAVMDKMRALPTTTDQAYLGRPFNEWTFCVWSGIPIYRSSLLAPDQWWPDYDGEGMPGLIRRDGIQET